MTTNDIAALRETISRLNRRAQQAEAAANVAAERWGLRSENAGRSYVYRTGLAAVSRLREVEDRLKAVEAERDALRAALVEPPAERQALNQVFTILRDLDCPLDVRVNMAHDVAGAALRTAHSLPMTAPTEKWHQEPPSAALVEPGEPLAVCADCDHPRGLHLSVSGICGIEECGCMKFKSGVERDTGTGNTALLHFTGLTHEYATPAATHTEPSK